MPPNFSVYFALRMKSLISIWLIFIILWPAANGESNISLKSSTSTSNYDILNYELNSEDNFDVVPLNEREPSLDDSFTYRKCFCGIQEIWKDGKCLPLGTDVLIPRLQNLTYYESDILSNFIFASVYVHHVECSSSEFPVIIQDGGIFLLENGELYHEESDTIFSPKNYCFELTGDVIGVYAEVCVQTPSVPICLGNGSEDISSATVNISLGNSFIGLENLQTYKVEEPKCVEADQKRVLPLSIHVDSLSFHLISGDVEVLWQPPSPATVPLVLPSEAYCLLEFQDDPSSLALTLCYDDPVTRHQKLCQESVCVRKCCPQDHIYDSSQRKCSVAQEPKNSSLPPFYSLQDQSYVETPDNLLMEYSFPWCSSNGSYLIDPKSNPADEFFLLNNGSLYITLSKLMMPPSLYCVESFVEKDESSIKAISCFLEEAQEKDYCKVVHRILYPILIIISCAFLAITLIVYSVIPELHAKLHGKSLLSHVSSLLVAFLCQLIVSWSSKSLSMLGCKIIALGNQVSFLWAFFWLNVMCFDIWWTLKSMSLIPETGESSRRRFALYSLYAWGVPIVITFLTAVLEFLPSSVDKSNLILPGFGVRGCWFQDVKSTWIYFHGFTLSLYVLNIFFFFHVAAILINGQMSNEGILRTTRKQHQERVYLYLKLFVVMGITWICEVASWQEGTCEYWIFTDIVNSLQGVMIFFIFMCNKNVFQKLHSKGVPLFRWMKGLVRAPSSTDSGVGRTTSTSQRTTQMSDESSSRRLSSSVPPNENQLIRQS